MCQNKKITQDFNRVIIIIEVHIGDKIHLPEDVNNNLKYETDFFIKHKKYLADEHTTKNKISQLLLKFKHGEN